MKKTETKESKATTAKKTATKKAPAKKAETATKKAAPTKKTATKTSAKTTTAKKPAAPKAAAPAPVKVEPPKPENPKVIRLRVTCMEGPWLDDKCIRYIDVTSNANLYDLHIAILDSICFDDEMKFSFFFAEELDDLCDREYIPEDFDGTDYDEFDTDVYEDMLVRKYARKDIPYDFFYVYKLDVDEWIFQIEVTDDEPEYDEKTFYPITIDSLSEGPNPEQYGSGFDDYSEDPEHFSPHGRAMYGNDEYNMDDERDDFFDDERDPWGSGDDYDEDDSDEW